MQTAHSPLYRAATLLLFSLLAANVEAAGGIANEPDETAASSFQQRLAKLRAIHPAKRSSISPLQDGSTTTNPPALLWPTVGGSKTRYSVQLSQADDFVGSPTISGAGSPWAFFNPHRKLADGTWYWRYGVVKKPGEKLNWSETYRFTIAPSARTIVSPPASDIIAACQSSHPRVLIGAGELPKLRQSLAGSDDVRQLVRSASRYAGKPLAEESKAEPKQKGSDAFESKNFAKWASKGYAGNLAQSTGFLAAAYLITGDEQIGREAARRAVFVALLDPDGVTSPKVSDFADGSCMRAMALGYDSCYDLFSDAERRQLREAMSVRAGRFFNRRINSLEGQVFNAHIWQHLLMDATDVALATLGEVPEAETWLTYVYELWTARFPLLGGDDGGWANGLNYFGTNFNTLLAMPSLFERLSVDDFFDRPWYRNAPYYLIYCWPPKSASDGFGDGAERDGTPRNSYARFVRALGLRFADPYALWYADQILGNQADEDLSAITFLQTRPMYRPIEQPQPKSPSDLPAARQFQDVGIVSMHTDLADSSRDLMVGFRSSPYGSFNHMHSDQNSFSLLFGGRRLFAPSGYYIAYGDEHFKGWYTATKGQNTVLIDGQGQVRGDAGFGVVARFLHGRQISYCLGDASRAYGHSGLTTFRRQVALLRPGTIVVYDELEADHAAQWSWLLHSPDRITADGNRLHVAGDTAGARVDLYASAPLDVSVTDQFNPPAVNWRGKKSGGQLLDYPNQWHATARPTAKASSMRILAMIQVRPKLDSTPYVEPRSNNPDEFYVGRWKINAALDAALPATLVVASGDGRVVLTSDEDAASLVEKESNIDIRCVDELPAAAR